jgi:hypothetical protein
MLRLKDMLALLKFCRTLVTGRNTWLSLSRPKPVPFSSSNTDDHVTDTADGDEFAFDIGCCGEKLVFDVFSNQSQITAMVNFCFEKLRPSDKE